MSHYADYVRERLGKRIYEDDHGFAVYFDTEHPEWGTVCYIEDIFVVPSRRRDHAATVMADEIAAVAKERGVKMLMGSVNPKTNGATASLKVLLGYGMQLDHVSADGLIFFVKSLEA